MKLSFRIPPGVDENIALDAIIRELTRDPPYGAKISTTNCETSNGWEQKSIPIWLNQAL